LGSVVVTQPELAAFAEAGVRHRPGSPGS